MFGNVHGVYSPGNVRLHPELLRRHQEFTKGKIGAGAEKKEEKPLFLVFHSEFRSTKAKFQTAIEHGVIKVNLDTDLQYVQM